MYDIISCMVHNLKAADELWPAAHFIQKPPESQTMYDWIFYGNIAKCILRYRGSASGIHFTVYFQMIKLLLCLGVQVHSADHNIADRKKKEIKSLVLVAERLLLRKNIKPC